MAVALAALFGAGALYCAEIIYGNVKGAGAPDLYRLPGWRAHMGFACVGSLAFVLALFLLESLGRGSKRVALKSTVPWLPMVALTATATVFHIPTYLVVSVALLYSPWAYVRTRATR